jgi:hypothetical protein
VYTTAEKYTESSNPLPALTRWLNAGSATNA